MRRAGRMRCIALSAADRGWAALPSQRPSRPCGGAVGGSRSALSLGRCGRLDTARRMPTSGSRCGREQTAWRPDALPGERATHAADRTPQSRSRTKQRGGGKSCTSIKTRLDRGAGVRSPCASAHVSPACLLLLLPGLGSGPCLCSCPCPYLGPVSLALRAAQGSPTDRHGRVGQGWTWAAHCVGLGPVLLGTHYASLRVLSIPSHAGHRFRFMPAGYSD